MSTYILNTYILIIDTDQADEFYTEVIQAHSRNQAIEQFVGQDPEIITEDQISQIIEIEGTPRLSRHKADSGNWVIEDIT